MKRLQRKMAEDFTVLMQRVNKNLGLITVLVKEVMVHRMYIISTRSKSIKTKEGTHSCTKCFHVSNPMVIGMKDTIIR